jgi:hypothetical protein
MKRFRPEILFANIRSAESPAKSAGGGLSAQDRERMGVALANLTNECRTSDLKLCVAWLSQIQQRLADRLATYSELQPIDAKVRSTAQLAARSDAVIAETM